MPYVSKKMKKIHWVNFIHIYQPPWQNTELVRRVTAESYDFLIGTLKAFPHFRMTLNIAGTLLETLADLGYSGLLGDIKKLIARRQIELTGSSHFHAFLPALPETEIRRQIQLQEGTLKKFFNYRPRGFFLPEMAYSRKVGLIVKSLGYQWLIVDPMSTKEKVDTDSKYISRSSGLTVVFRNRVLSKSYPPEKIYHLLQNHREGTIITATDGELYGHFHKDWQEHLRRILQSLDIETLMVGEYLERLTDIRPVYLRSASWETKSRQVRNNNPFAIWLNRSNLIHRRLWHLAQLAIRAVAASKNDANYFWSRYHLDRGLSSCSWWWASEIKTSTFAPIAWSPDEIEKGALELMKSIRSLQGLGAAEKIRGEKIYHDLLEHVWEKHWNHYGH